LVSRDRGEAERAEGAASKLLRRGLLQDSSVALALAGDAVRPESPAAHTREALGDLGARVWSCAVLDRDGAAGEEELDRLVRRAYDQRGNIDVLVVDGAGIFQAAGASRAGLAVCLQAAWNVTRALANIALIPQGGGRIVYLAPAPGDGAHAQAARAGLENLCRTLSIEWARHAITTVTIAPGTATAPDEVAAVVAYLCSAAGAYFSGCVLDLGGGAATAAGSAPDR
jgi:NAD(P)-dependent dehydrogenase (short-subunit alcohol dehydrogenase family)